MTYTALVLFLMVIAFGGGCYFVAVALLRGDHPAPPNTPLGSLSAEQKKKREDVIAKFHQIHNTARDNRKQVAKLVNNDPARAAQFVSKMLKR